MKIYFTVLIMLISFVSFSQQTCGTDEMHQKLYMGFPGIHKKVIQNNKTLEEFTKSYVLANNKRKMSTINILRIFAETLLDLKIKPKPPSANTIPSILRNTLDNVV